MYNRYPSDPYWCTAKYKGRCAGCNKPFNRGERIFYYPRTRKPFAENCGCGQGCERDFIGCAQDEYTYNR